MSEIISTAFLMGGLGNQMFQAAHALAQGKKNNVPVKFRCESWTPMQGRQTSVYRENIFRNLDFNWVDTPLTRVVEGPWEYSEVTADWSNPTEFYGYFQSSKNFLGYDDYIREVFSPSKEFIEETFEKYPQLNQDNTLSIHIRLGDYTQNPHIHPSISVEYINRALSEVGSYSHVFVFSEDKEWIEKNISLVNMTVVNEEDWKEMWMISLCKNNINSNSTFSWWGAFLNQNPNKKVVAPSMWFGPSGPQNYKDIYESYWTVLDVQYDNGLLK